MHSASALTNPDSPEPSEATQAALSSVFDAVLGRVLAPDFKLPMLPAVASQALAVASDPDISFQRIVKVLQEDPVIAARVMAVANSPLYSMGTTVTTLLLTVMPLFEPVGSGAFVPDYRRGV